MNKKDLIEYLLNSKSEYGTVVLDFINSYADYVDLLINKIKENKCSDKEEYIIKKLIYWLDEEGYKLFFGALSQINNYTQDKMKGFAELYYFLLYCSLDNTEKLVDHLFYIPGQFFREFMSEKRELFGKIDDSKACVEVDSTVSYTVKKLGVSKGIPFLIKGGQI